MSRMDENETGGEQQASVGELYQSRPDEGWDELPDSPGRQVDWIPAVDDDTEEWFLDESD